MAALRSRHFWAIPITDPHTQIAAGLEQLVILSLVTFRFRDRWTFDQQTTATDERASLECMEARPVHSQPLSCASL